MYKIELDKNGIIRGKCTINATIDAIKKAGTEGMFVSDEIGESLDLPCEPIYDGKGDIVGGTYRPDLMPKQIIQPTLDDRLKLLENTISGLNIKVDGLIQKNITAI
jgi:hypothetical protein